MLRIKIIAQPLTKHENRALVSSGPLDATKPKRGTSVSKHRATALREKNAIQINVYGHTNNIVYMVRAEKLAPIVARFLSELDELSQENCFKIV